jgi:autotransporter-associated beta strand protein
VNGTLTSTRYNALPNITLNGATLVQSATDTGSYNGYQFLGSVTVGGSAASTISTGNNKGNHLLPAGTTFTVADVTGNGTPSLLVSAPLLNGSGDYAGAAGLTKAGPGVMALSGVNTYTGPTTVNAGTLAIGVAGTGSITSAVTVNTGGILAGSGTVTGAVTVASGGALAPGNNGPGTLTVAGNAALAAGSTFNVKLNGTAAGTGYSQLVVSPTGANLDLSGSPSLVGTLGYTPSASDRLFIAVLTDPGSTITGQFSQGTTVTIGGFSASISYTGNASTNAITGGNNIVLYGFAPVPEPAGVLGLTAAGLGLIGYTRRRQRG